MALEIVTTRPISLLGRICVAAANDLRGKMSDANPPITARSGPSSSSRRTRGERGYDLPSRLLKERIIFVTGVVEDHMAASICMQLLFLRGRESQERNLHVHQFPGRCGHRRDGDLRHHAVRAPADRDLMYRPGRVDGLPTALRGHPWHALRAGQRAHHGASAIRGVLGPGERYRTPC